MNCVLCGVVSDDTPQECGHQVCSVCLARSLTDQRRLGSPFGWCAVDGCCQVLRKHRLWPWHLGGRVQLATRSGPTLLSSGGGSSRRGRGGSSGRGRGRGRDGSRGVDVGGGLNGINRVRLIAIGRGRLNGGVGGGGLSGVGGGAGFSGVGGGAVLSGVGGGAGLSGIGGGAVLSGVSGGAGLSGIGGGA